jgi:signal transduction histidine kinase
VRHIILRASELVGPDLRKRKIKFSYEFEDANWETIVNKNQMMEVFLNLFINAMDAMPQGGELSVQGLVETPPHKKEPYLAVRVTDTGVGIKKEHLSRVFERYYTTKDNGTLHLTSKPGKGTSFTVYLPHR